MKYGPICHCVVGCARGVLALLRAEKAKRKPAAWVELRTRVFQATDQDQYHQVDVYDKVL